MDFALRPRGALGNQHCLERVAKKKADGIAATLEVVSCVGDDHVRRRRDGPASGGPASVPTEIYALSFRKIESVL